MEIYAFASRKNPNMIAFTSDTTGDNLPNKYAPWFKSNGSQAIATGDGTDPVSAIVGRDGYFVAADRSIR